MWVLLWDKLDAKMLAKLLGGDMLVCSYVPPHDVRDERETVRLRASLVRMGTQVINKIRSIFHKYCIKYQGPLYQKSGMEFLNTLDLRPVDMSAIKSYLETRHFLISSGKCLFQFIIATFLQTVDINSISTFKA